jgi:hypothetical protein
MRERITEKTLIEFQFRRKKGISHNKAQEAQNEV